MRPHQAHKVQKHAHFYRRSVVCVCLLNITTSYNGYKQLQGDAAWHVEVGGPKEPCIKWDPDSPEKWQFFWGGGAPCDAAFHQNSLTACKLSRSCCTISAFKAVSQNTFYNALRVVCLIHNKRNTKHQRTAKSANTVNYTVLATSLH